MTRLPAALPKMNLSEAEAFNAFIGSWQLVSMTVYRADGSAIHPMGADAVGQIMYSANGFMSCHLMEANRSALPGHGLDHASDTELGQAARTYSGYFGPFTIDAEAGVVTHHVAGAWYPNMVGIDQVRRFAFVDDLLVLEADVNDDIVRLEWRRPVAASG